MPYISYEEIHSQQRVTALVAQECQAMREARDGWNYRRRQEYGVVDESEEEEDGETTDGQDKEGLTAVLKAYLYHDPPLHPRRQVLLYQIFLLITG
jgi:hypothetical protein